jgi:cbb3-type cytochrome oxidase maturation protein
MNYLAWLVPIALGMGIAGLAAFFWSMRNGQYEDLDGAAERILLAEAEDSPLLRVGWKDEAAQYERTDRGNPPSADAVHAEDGVEGTR